VTPRTEAPNEARVLSSAFSAVARALRPSVVRIDVEIEHPQVANRGQEDDDDLAPFFRHFFGQGGPEPARAAARHGSGVVMDRAGDIVTNRHVVSGRARSRSPERRARIHGEDAGDGRGDDVAVIRLEKPPTI
jgi:S1-C subfamily serine protease